jgi:hypothetical protein
MHWPRQGVSPPKELCSTGKDGQAGMTPMAVGPEIEPYDFHILFDRFPAFRLRAAFVKAGLYLLEKIAVGGLLPLWTVEPQVGTQRDASLTLEGLQDFQIAIRDQGYLRHFAGENSIWDLH